MSRNAGNNGLITDACPSPPRDQEKPDFESQFENISSNHVESPKEPLESITNGREKQRFSTHKSKKSKYKTTAQATIFNINGSSKVHIGSKINININNCDKQKETKPTKDIVMTEEIKKFLESENLFQRDDLTFISDHIVKWKDLGRVLGYSDGQLDKFNGDNYTQGIKEVIFQLLWTWTQEHPSEATFSNLGQILWNCNEKDAVQRLANEIYSKK